MAASEEEFPNVKSVEIPGSSYSEMAWHQFKKNRPSMVGLYAILILTFIAIFADLLAGNKPIYMEYRGTTYYPAFRQYLVYLKLGDFPKELKRRRNLKRLKADAMVLPPIPYGPSEIKLTEKYLPPNSDHWLGTDRLGRDVFSGLIHGTRYALTIGIVSVSISLIIGVTLGGIAGYFGGVIDLALSRLFELWAAIPVLLLILTASAVMPPSIFWVMLILGVTGWVGIARLTRSQFLQVRSYDYVAAANSLGYSTSRIMFFHILPNAIAPILVPVAFGVASAILTEAGLSFLGIGIPAEAITWGSILAGARSNSAAWWLVVVPGMAIFLAVTMYNLLGDGLRDALDPKMKIER
jgi:peptide/nickel transport system permease protein